MTIAQSLFETHLTVSNLSTSIAFYRDVVGLEPAHTVPERQAAFFWIGPRGRTMLGLWGSGHAPQRVCSHIAFAASLTDVLLAPPALRAAGVTPLDFNGHETDEPVVLGWMPAACIYFHDRDGHLLEYVAMLPDPPAGDRGIVPWGTWRAEQAHAAGNQRPLGEPRHRASRVVRILTISGSLRAVSSNTALLEAAQRLAPAGIEVSPFARLATLPPFNPDLDSDTPPSAVEAFRAALRNCDALLISSPEYAHGVAGVLKNALDWIVGSGELIDKPVGLVNTSTRATHAWSALLETVSVMSARVVRAASITVPVSGQADVDALVQDTTLARSLVSILDALRLAALGLEGAGDAHGAAQPGEQP